MSEKTIEIAEQSGFECLKSLSEALKSVERIISERLGNKMSAGKMPAVAREIKELIKVVSVHGC